MKISGYYIFIVILVVFTIMNCDLPENTEDPLSVFYGIWRSKDADGTDFQRLTINEDKIFVMQEYQDDTFVQTADGTWSYNTDTFELTAHIDNTLSGEVYGPPPDGELREMIYYATAKDDRVLIGCFLGGNTQTGSGNWEMMREASIGDAEYIGTIGLNLTVQGDLTFSFVEVVDGETVTDISCNADYSFDGNQIIVTNSTDTEVLNNGTYTYEIVSQGFYFSKLNDIGVYPFQREE